MPESTNADGVLSGGSGTYQGKQSKTFVFVHLLVITVVCFICLQSMLNEYYTLVLLTCATHASSSGSIA
jgi:hypothetical protein